jgi:hypothetical protein
MDCFTCGLFIATKEMTLHCLQHGRPVGAITVHLCDDCAKLFRETRMPRPPHCCPEFIAKEADVTREAKCWKVKRKLPKCKE